MYLEYLYFGLAQMSSVGQQIKRNNDGPCDKILMGTFLKSTFKP